jgi:hypothetical protein
LEIFEELSNFVTQTEGNFRGNYITGMSRQRNDDSRKSSGHAETSARFGACSPESGGTALSLTN